MVAGMNLVVGLLAFITGLSVGWFLAQKKSAAAQQERERAAEQQNTFVEESLKQMSTAFKGLAFEALQLNNQQFLQNTDVKLKPVNDALEKMQEANRALELKRDNAYTLLSKQIGDMLGESTKMRESSEEMQNLLKGSSQVRGNWGELLLERIVEFAGMQKHVDFETQSKLSDGSRPDMVIKLPKDVEIPVDAKCPLTAFKNAKEATNLSQAKELMKEHAKAVKGHVKELTRRNYAALTPGDIDFTIMFMPGDHLLEAALGVDPELQDYAYENKILITNPVTLVALLRTVRIYWQNDETNRDAQKIADAANELYTRIEVWMNNYADLGKALNTAVTAYTKTRQSYRGRLVPSGKRLQATSLTLRDKTPLDDPQKGPPEVNLIPDDASTDSAQG